MTVAKQRIDLARGNSQPIFLRSTGRGLKVQEFEKMEIDKTLLQMGIKPASTEWAAQIIYASEKKISQIFCIGYRKLNATAKRDS